MLSDQNANESMISVIGQNRLGSEASNNTPSKDNEPVPSITLVQNNMLDNIPEAQSVAE